MSAVEDPAVGVPLPVPAPGPLRVYEPPPVWRQGRLPLDGRLPARPESATLRLNGQRYRLRHWSAEEWERTPAGERPAVTVRGNRGGWFGVEVADAEA